MMWGAHAITLRPFFDFLCLFFFSNQLDFSRNEGLEHLLVFVVKIIARDYNLKLCYENVAWGPYAHEMRNSRSRNGRTRDAFNF